MSPTTHGTQTGVVAALRFLWPYWSLLLQPACLHSPPSRTNPHGSIIQLPSALLSFATKFLNQRNNSWSTKMSSTIRFGEYKISHFKFKIIVALLQSVNLCQRKNVVVGVVDIVHWTTGQTFLWTDTQHHLFMWLWELGKKIEVDGWGMRSLYGIDEGAVLYLNWCVHGVTASVSKHWLDYTFTNTSYVRRFKKCQWWWL